MQKAIIARSSEALGQDVLQDQVQEIDCGQRAHFQCPTLAVPVVKADLSVVAGQDVGLPDHAAIKVAPQIDECLVAVTHTFAIDHPFGGSCAGKASPACFSAARGLPRDTLASAWWLNPRL